MLLDSNNVRTKQKIGFDSIEISLVIYNFIAQTSLDSDKPLISLKSLKWSVLFVESSGQPLGWVDQVEIRLTSATSWVWVELSWVEAEAELGKSCMTKNNSKLG